MMLTAHSDAQRHGNRSEAGGGRGGRFSNAVAVIAPSFVASVSQPIPETCRYCPFDGPRARTYLRRATVTAVISANSFVTPAFRRTPLSARTGRCPSPGPGACASAAVDLAGPTSQRWV